MTNVVGTLRVPLLGFLLLNVCTVMPSNVAAQSSYAEVVAQTQPKIVKIFGAGGLRGLEAYQSGFLISPDGHILTVWSYVLDREAVTVYLVDGRKLTARTRAGYYAAGHQHGTK